MNVPADHPGFAGFDPGPLLAKCDLGLLLDTDVPWVPTTHAENPATRFIHVDVDAAKRDLPLWNFPADLRVQGDCATVLRQVLATVEALADDSYRARLDDHGERRFEEVGRAFGAHAERVTEPEQVEAAIDRCLAALERGQAAVLTARVTPL